MEKGDVVEVGKLKEGDTFWLMGRGFIVLGVDDDGVRTECLDDGGTPKLDPGFPVELVTQRWRG